MRIRYILDMELEITDEIAFKASAIERIAGGVIDAETGMPKQSGVELGIVSEIDQAVVLVGPNPTRDFAQVEGIDLTELKVSITEI